MTLAGGRSQTLSSETDQGRGSFTKGTIIDHSIDHSNHSSLASGSDVGSRTAENFLDLDGHCVAGPCEPVVLPSLEKDIPHESIQSLTLMVHHEVEDESVGSMSASSEINASAMIPKMFADEGCASFNSKCSNSYSLLDGSIVNSLSTTSNLSCAGRPCIAVTQSSNTTLTNQVLNACITNIHSEQAETSDSHNSLEFTQYFHEGYCKVSELDDCRELTEAVTDADSSSSHCEREKPEEDGDNDDMLGGVFAFSEEG